MNHFVLETSEHMLFFLSSQRQKVPSGLAFLRRGLASVDGGCEAVAYVGAWAHFYSEVVGATGCCLFGDLGMCRVLLPPRTYLKIEPGVVGTPRQ